MTPEMQRVIEEAQPRWFLRENVPRAPDVKPLGYEVTSFLLCNSWLDSGDGHGEEQMRKRRFWFGWRSSFGQPPNLMRWIKQAVFELPMPSLAVNGGHEHFDFRPREKAITVQGGHDATLGNATARHHGEIGVTGGHRGHAPRYTLAEMLELQGLPPDFLDHCPMTVQGKRKAIGNGVAVPTGRAIARAIRKALEEQNDG
jgi:hypothetical protein